MKLNLAILLIGAFQLAAARQSGPGIINGQHRQENKAVLTDSTGVRYEGALVNGVRQGEGVLDSAGYKYTGHWQNGKKNGMGICVYPDGSRYSGNWVDDYYSGNGNLYDAAGNIVHKGNWKEGKFVDLNVPELADLKRVYAAAANEFKGAIGKLKEKKILYQGDKPTKIFYSDIKVGGGKAGGEVKDATITDFGTYMRFEENVTFKNIAERDSYIKTLASTLPAAAPGMYGIKLPGTKVAAFITPNKNLENTVNIMVNLVRD